MIWLLFGQNWEKLGNFLFHQLVTLNTSHDFKKIISILCEVTQFEASFHYIKLIAGRFYVHCSDKWVLPYQKSIHFVTEYLPS